MKKISFYLMIITLFLEFQFYGGYARSNSMDSSEVCNGLNYSVSKNDDKSSIGLKLNAILDCFETKSNLSDEEILKYFELALVFEAKANEYKDLYFEDFNSQWDRRFINENLVKKVNNIQFSNQAKKEKIIDILEKVSIPIKDSQ